MTKSVCVCLCTGVENSHRIQKNVKNAIAGNMSLFCLGFGEHVEYSFLDVMARQNQGVARRIYEASDATVQLKVCSIALNTLSEISRIFCDTVNPYYMGKTHVLCVFLCLSGFL